MFTIYYKSIMSVFMNVAIKIKSMSHLVTLGIIIFGIPLITSVFSIGCSRVRKQSSIAELKKKKIMSEGEADKTGKMQAIKDTNTCTQTSKSATIITVLALNVNTASTQTK
jgi:hypothetical protein